MPLSLLPFDIEPLLVLALDVRAAALGGGFALVDDHALKVLALGLLGGDFPDDGLEVGVVLM